MDQGKAVLLCITSPTQKDERRGMEKLEEKRGKRREERIKYN